ncbi:zinc knuckle CX2CX4HX4C [Artemisia annua]|uniref:Zinc knuckle CX2CX4HX4C n=1 Tax=Artemisia annua TaxID=35608 RepID=A0A2U1PK28_ARTAN|nr:zinc knuckle CX2CX4HX4C [Artemisia annua]
MSQQEPKPPNPDVTYPPPVVNPPSSRSDKNLKTKKTTRTMNPKPASTMKHHDMLSKSTDVNFNKVITRSSSKGSDTGMGVEEMEYEEESNEVRAKKVVVAIQGKMVLVTNVSESVAVKEVNGNKDVSGDVVNGNVSDMFPELSSVNLNKKCSDKIDIMPDIPVPVELNPLLNPKLNSGGGSRDNFNGMNVSKDGAIGKEERVGGDNTEVQGMKENKYGVGESSGNKDVVMEESNKARKPMLFSNVVQGASYIGGYGRASYARVLIEVDATKGLVDSVEIWYRNLNRSMKLKVEYAWQPPICSHCCVFGHGSEECSSRVLAEKEKNTIKEQNGQAKASGSNGQKTDEGWQYVDNRKANRNYGEQKSGGESGVQQNQSYNYYGVGNNRGGMYMGRGGPSFRGRGGFNGRGGMGSYQMSSDKKNSQVKENVKGKEFMGENVQKREKNKGVNSGKEDQVKFIAQRNFFSKNRFDALKVDGNDDMMNEWQGVKVNIDVACEMGIPFDENEVAKWPQELKTYYNDKCANMKNSDKRDLLLNKIRNIEGDINCSRANIEQNSYKFANEGVAFEMENTGANREQAFGVEYCVGVSVRGQELTFEMGVIMGLKLRVTTDVLNAAEVWCLPIDKKLKYSSLMVSCSVFGVCISFGMWDCNWIFLMGVWLLSIPGRGLSREANVWTGGVLLMWKIRWWSSDLSSMFWEHSNCFNLFSPVAGFLPMVNFYRPAVLNDYGIWIIYCSYVYYGMDEFADYPDDGLWIAWCSMNYTVFESYWTFMVSNCIELVCKYFGRICMANGHGKSMVGELQLVVSGEDMGIHKGFVQFKIWSVH